MIRTWRGRVPHATGMVLGGWLIASGCGGGDESRLGRAAFDPDSVPDAYLHSTAALMWPGATRAFQVTASGDLYNGEWTVRIRPTVEGEAAGPPRTMAFEGRWLPHLRWARAGRDVRWDFSAVALPEPVPRDTGLLVSLVARATNAGRVARDAAIAMALEPPEPHPIFVAFDAPETPSPPFRWGAGTSSDTVYGWSREIGEGARLQASWRLAPGESRTLRLILPTYPTTARTLARAAGRPHGRWIGETRRYWESELERATRFELADPEVEDALKAARIVMLSCRERRGSRWVPIGGPFQYRDVWLRDGARMAHALAIAGHTAVARQLVAGLADFQWPQGAFLSQRGQPDGTGQALWAFQQVLLRPAPADSLSRYLDAAVRAWRWF